MQSKYSIGDLVAHTVFGAAETNIVTDVEPMDSLTDPYIYEVGGGSWWIAESDLTLVQIKNEPEVTSKLSISDAMERGIQYTDGQYFGDYLNLRTDASNTKGFACALGTAVCGLKEKTPRELVLGINKTWQDNDIQKILKQEWPELFAPYRDHDSGFSQLGEMIYEANDIEHKTISEIIADLKKEGK